MKNSYPIPLASLPSIPSSAPATTATNHCSRSVMASISKMRWHLSMTLKSAAETNTQVCEQTERSLGGLAWATYHSLEIFTGLVESLLSGLAQQGASG
ncbi:hypothetical protein [Pseudomonas bharatica]|uniref:hypothetical protein n=1 Tax=Pseudomonas bharatica TaxID=2692112 RepID=UPI001F0428C9|nr:hypothetical protein [Pseudomonas bharatica]